MCYSRNLSLYCIREYFTAGSKNIIGGQYSPVCLRILCIQENKKGKKKKSKYKTGNSHPLRIRWRLVKLNTVDANCPKISIVSQNNFQLFFISVY